MMTVDSAAKDDSRNEAGYERPDGILSRPSSSVNLFGKTLSAKQVADEDSCHERRRQNLDTPAGVRSGAPYWYNYPAAIGRTSERCADRGEETSEDGVIPIKSIDSVSQCSGISNGGSTVEVEKEGKEGLTGLRSGCKAASIRHKISQWEERSGDGPGATWGRGPEVDGGTSRMLDWKKNISSRYQAPNNRPLQPNRDNDLGGRLQAKICEAGKSCTRNGDPQGHSSRIYSTRERLGVSLSFREASQHFLACSKNDSASESAAPINCENQIKNPPRVCKKELKEVSMKSPDSIGQVSVGLCEERVMRQHTSSKAQKDQCDDSAKGPQSKNIMLEKGRCKKNVYDWSPTVRPCMDSKEEIEEKEQKRKILLESDDSCNIPAIWNRNEANSENNFACVSLALNKNLQQHEDKGSSITTSKGKGNHYNMGIQLNRPSSTDSRAQNCVQSTFEVEGYPIHTETCPSKEPKPSPTHTAVSTKHRSSKETSVLLRVQALEAAAKTSPNQGVPEMPGLYYSMDSLGSKSRGSQDSGESRVLRVPKAQHRRGSSETTASETDYSTIDSPSGHSLGPLDMENIYTDPGSPSPPSPSSPLTTINPLPKPRRTFEYRTGARRAERPSRRFHSNRLVLPATPPPLPSTPAPALCRNNSVGPARCRYGSHRRSFEFEDLPNRTQPESGGSGSEENIYEDILDPSRENPYEDVAEVIPGSGLSDVRCPVTLSPTCLSQTRRPLNVSGPTMSDPLRRAQMRFNPHCNAHSSPSNLEEFNIMELPTTNKDVTVDDSIVSRCGLQLVQKINSVFTAKRGKKRWKKYSVSSPESCSMKDENSDSESDSDERLKEHTVRLAHMASLRRNLRGQRTLERELLERQQRQLFEYFVVVALRKKAHAASCLPELTYQFPKLERLTKEVREAEERLRAIPQFCFPDAKEWSPLTDFPSETFSFVLTYEDGTRRFGYCRRLLPSGKGPRLPEVYCIISRLGCFNLFSTILDEVEKRRQVSSALVYPFMRALLEATVPAPGRSIRVKSFMPDSGNEGVELRRPADSRLEHIDFSCLLSCLGTRHLLRLFASLLLERRVILTADKLSTLSKCGHAIVALLYPFTWQHTYIPVLPVSMLDIVCAPTPFLIGLLSSALPRLHSLPIEEVLVVDLCSDRFLKQMEDEDSILPRKLHSAMEHLLDQMEEIVTQEAESSDEEEAATPTDGTALDMLVSETFVRFFVEVLGHYSLHMSSTERGERTFQRESFRKSVASKSIRRFLEVFMQTQMFAGFVHDRELRKAGVRGLFELRAAQFLEENSEAEISGVNKFLKGLGNKMRFLSKKY